MNNKTKEFFADEAEDMKIGTEEIILDTENNIFDEAKKIAQETGADRKYPFTFKYDANRKDFLVSVINTVGATIESDYDTNILRACMNMRQLKLIKSLDCVERVISDKVAVNPFLAEKADNVLSAEENTVQVMTLAIDEPTENDTASVMSVSDGVAVASTYCCPTNADMESAQEIEIETFVDGCICCPGAEQWFKFTVPNSDTYTIYTTGLLDTVGALYDCCGNLIVEVDDHEPCGKTDFRIIQTLDAGTTYYIKVTEAKSNTGDYRLKVTEKRLVDYIYIRPTNLSLEIGKTYELPILPYTFANVDGAEPLSNLAAYTVPIVTDEERVLWYSFDDDVIRITSGWHNGQRYQTVTVVGEGTAKLYAYDWNGDGKAGECTISVNSTDPFDPSNVEYVRIKKWRSVKTTNGLNYTECDMSTSVTKSYIDDLTYFTVFFPDEDQITTFEINYTLINQLNDIESQYQSQFFKQGSPLCFHKGKEYADIFVSEGKIEYASPEYYGIWAYNGNAVCEINDRLSFVYALATIAYSGFMYGFTKITSMQSMQMRSGQTKTYTNSQYIDAVKSQKAIADISDDVAIQLGKTDISSTSTVRRTWRASEMRVAEYYPTSSGYEYNKSYKIIGGKLTTVPHGTAGSQRPDFYNPLINHIVEVKNYTITTSTGRNSLANNIAMQYNSRRTMFPDANIEFIVDVTGQSYTQSMLDEIVDLVSTLTGEDIVRFIYD